MKMEQNIQTKENKNTYGTAKGTLGQELQPCPVFQGRHKWSLLAFKSDNGMIRYCQFCFLEKLVPFAYNSLTEYYQPGTYYAR